ncbi:hypothetical protein [Pseudoflavonifractor sp. MSJ-37]|uniref:hypothetical protein n=1 Tax=Pseudoflavonifractor sp. MSJ-37 TaxID=2841531 RepID=UPI001C112C72|nr:hypothetical protein [Pseudoflavonifractor sp. MSJ-37]MBU5436020.1 hypothetical protein [Pseudoflavonifractor sp. MSJ-37]
MKQVSFEGIGQVLATFETEEGVKEGQVVKLTGDGRVGPCAAGDPIAGVALVVKNGFASVQVRGFAAVAASGVTAGWAKLSADGKGGMKEDSTAGRDYLAADTDSAAGTVTVLL